MKNKYRNSFRVAFLLVVMILSFQSFMPGLASAEPPAPRKKILIDVPFISQVVFKDVPDSNGKPYLLGNSSEILLWSDGCGVASLAMVYARWGLATCLPCLNELLKKTGGFAGALLRLPDKPKAVANAGAPFIKEIVNISTSRPQDYKDKVDAELAEGRPVIVFINHAHFVVITGIDENGHYLINDPWQKTEAEGKNIPFADNMTRLGFNAITQFDFVFPEDNAPTNGIVVRGRIRDAYFEQGGSKGAFGNPVSQDTEDTMFNDLYPWQKFEHGAILDVNGEVRYIYGPLWRKVQQLGGLEKTGLPHNSQYSYWAGGEVVHAVDLQGMTLRWTDKSPEDQVQALYPDDAIRVEYFSNPDLHGTPIHIGVTDRIMYSWGNSRPLPWLDPQSFSMRWTGEITSRSFIGWFYTFRLTGQGRYRLSLDGRVVLDAWDRTASEKITRYLRKGKHTLLLEYAKTGDEAAISFHWSAWPGSPVFAAENGSAGPVDYLPASVTDYQDDPAEQSGGFSEPDQPVRELMDAIAAADSDRAVQTLAPSDRSLGKLLVSVFQDAIQLNNADERVEFREMDYSVNLQGGEDAIVTVDGLADLYNVDNELVDSRSFILEIPVRKQESNWYVSLNLKKVYELIREYQKSP
jgi:hypothetical protein